MFQSFTETVLRYTMLARGQVEFTRYALALTKNPYQSIATWMKLLVDGLYILFYSTLRNDHSVNFLNILLAVAAISGNEWWWWGGGEEETGKATDKNLFRGVGGGVI